MSQHHIIRTLNQGLQASPKSSISDGSHEIVASKLQQEEMLEKLKEMILGINFTQEDSYSQEMDHLFKDIDLAQSYLPIYLLILVLNHSEQQAKEQRDITSSNVEVTSPNMSSQLDISKQIDKPIQMVMSYINIYAPELNQHLPPNFGKNEQLPQTFPSFTSQPQILNRLTILLKYFVINDFRSLSKQFFKLVPLSHLVNNILMDPMIYLFQHSFFINLIYKLIYKHSYYVNDKKILPNLYWSFKTDNLKDQKPGGQPASLFFGSLTNKRKFSINLIQSNYQYTLLRFQQHHKQVLLVCQRLFLEIINQKMYIFIADFANFQQFGLLIKDKQIFDSLIMRNDDPLLLILQIRILKIISKKYNLVITNNQHDQLILKYQQLIQQEDHLEKVYTNHTYLLCAISLMLSQFQNSWQNKYNQYQNISKVYMKQAHNTILKIQCQQTLFLVLFQKHYLQQDTLINILFQNMEHFGVILNNPIVYNVLQQLWMGNRQYSNNFMLETYQTQVLSSSYKIIIGDHFKSYYQTTDLNQSDDHKKLIENLRETFNEKPQTYYNLNDLELQENQFKKRKSLRVSMTSQDLQQKNSEFITMNSTGDKHRNGNIFSFIKTDSSNIFLRRNYIYQYQIYLHNLNFKKIYEILTLLTFFLLFLLNIRQFIDGLNEPVLAWDPYMSIYLKWQVHADNSSGDQPVPIPSLIKQYQNVNFFTPQQVIEISRNHSTYIYCQHRQNHFFWPKISLKEKFYKFCCKIMLFEEFRQQSKLSIFNHLCMINVFMSLKSLLSILYQLLVNKVVFFSINYIYDLIILVAQSIMFYQNNVFENEVYISDKWLYYYYYLQVISITVTFILYLKIIKSIKVFKKIGLYIIILQNIIAQTGYFMLYLFCLMTIIGICFMLMFKGVDPEYDYYVNSLLSVYLFPLGSMTVHEKAAFNFHDYTNKKALMYIQNVLTIFVTFVLMVILLNMLIALLSNMYQRVVDFTQREFSYVLFTDYQQNIPNKFYSSMELVPMYLSIVLIFLSPFMIYFKSARFNTALNISIYLFKFFIPFMIIYYTINIVLSPLVYMKILYCILSHNYQNQHYKPIHLPFSTRFCHFIQFFFFGWFYLLYRILVVDLLYIVKKSQQNIPERFDLIFNVQLYRIFKKTLMFFKYFEKIESMPVGDFNLKLQENLDKLKMENQKEMQERLQFLQLRLRKRAEQQDQGNIDINYFLQMMSIMKNKKQEGSHGEYYWHLQKMKQMEIIFNQHELLQNNEN